MELFGGGASGRRRIRGSRGGSCVALHYNVNLDWYCISYLKITSNIEEYQNPNHGTETQPDNLNLKLSASSLDINTPSHNFRGYHTDLKSRIGRLDEFRSEGSR